MDLEDPEGLPDRTDPSLLLIDDQAVLVSDLSDAFQQFDQELSALVYCMKVVSVASVFLHASDDLHIVVYSVWIDDPDVLRRLGADVNTLPQHFLTG